MLDRMSETLQEAGIPHRNQSAYRKKVSCGDATQEVIARYYVREGSRVYSVCTTYRKPLIPLNTLYFSRGCLRWGSMGRLLKSWYEGM